MYAREIVDNVEIVYMNVYAPQVRRKITKFDKPAKKMAAIIDYSAAKSCFEVRRKLRYPLKSLVCVNATD